MLRLAFALAAALAIVVTGHGGAGDATAAWWLPCGAVCTYVCACNGVTCREACLS